MNLVLPASVLATFLALSTPHATVLQATVMQATVMHATDMQAKVLQDKVLQATGLQASVLEASALQTEALTSAGRKDSSGRVEPKSLRRGAPQATRETRGQDIVESRTPNWVLMTDSMVCGRHLPDDVFRQVDRRLISDTPRLDALQSQESSCYRVDNPLRPDQIFRAYLAGGTPLDDLNVISWDHSIDHREVYGWTFSSRPRDECKIWDLVYLPSEGQIALFEYELETGLDPESCEQIQHRLGDGEHILAAVDALWYPVRNTPASEVARLSRSSPRTHL